LIPPNPTVMEILFYCSNLEYTVMLRHEASATVETPACGRQGFFVPQNDRGLKKIVMNGGTAETDALLLWLSRKK